MDSYNYIYSCEVDGGIGLDGDLLFRNKYDLKLFKYVTYGQIVVMGRRTWYSIPIKYRPLRGRINIIVSSTMDQPSMLPNTYVIRSLDELESIKTLYPTKSIFIVGGATLYNALWPKVGIIFETKYNASLPHDTKIVFPQCTKVFLDIIDPIILRYQQILKKYGFEFSVYCFPI
jgi:dihydrofolate reductase